MNRRQFLYIVALLLTPGLVPAQEGLLLPVRRLQQPLPTATGVWHGQSRALRYHPEGSDFVIVNGTRRFNRALYGTHTAFRVEAGDLPEFALYMPGMGGNWQFGLIKGDNSKWLIRANHIKASYRPGSMLYEIKDSLLRNGTLHIAVLALDEAEGMIIRVSADSIDPRTRLVCTFGGASGKKFSRDGDIGADPESSFYCKPENCGDDHYTISDNRFKLSYNGPGKNAIPAALEGIFPSGTRLQLTDATGASSPSALLHSAVAAAPVVAAEFSLGASGTWYFCIRNPAGPSFAATQALVYDDLFRAFDRAERTREKLAGRVQINTPDPYINTVGGALSIAADAIWEEPSYLHGAVAWRMRLPAWRGPYVADPLGWHDRARQHFSSYALSQITSPELGPVVADTALRLARQLEKLGTALFSNGYISRNPGGDIRPHHYDMNLVFIDELLDHFYWTGDTAYVRSMWPVIQRHLAWEKRNFDMDGDGLYDAYCCIWASDALEYSGGGVTHSSAYNFRANKMAADLAVMIGEDPSPYRVEADKILHAMNTKLWMPAKGAYAEYIDREGSTIHPSAGLWTIYHAIDSRVPDPFQSWQSLHYIDTDIPHIRVLADELEDTTLYTLSTTNWQPYTWSLNNVVMAESLHTALAFWQGGRRQAAWSVWKGALVESMYLGASPGNFQQITSYDAMRGELYRDFADPIGMAARSLVEGLFGIRPDALHDTLTIEPGWPSDWDHASLQIPDIGIGYTKNNNKDSYTIVPAFAGKMNLRLRLKAQYDVLSVTVNGKAANWTNIDDAIGEACLQVVAAPAASYTVEIVWSSTALAHLTALAPVYAEGESLDEGVLEGLDKGGREATILSVYDPQRVLVNPVIINNSMHGVVRQGTGRKMLFIQLQQGRWKWWRPVYLRVASPVEIQTRHGVWLRSHTVTNEKGNFVLNYGTGKDRIPIVIMAGVFAARVPLSNERLQPGSNNLRFENDNGQVVETMITNWAVRKPKGARYETVNLSRWFNDAVTQIFKNQYLSPRPVSPTLQLPTQGIGNWCYPSVTAHIDDAGLREKAGGGNEIVLPGGIPLATPGRGTADGIRGAEARNIIFTSRWDNYPDSVSIPLRGKALHAYFLLAGSTNPMQSHITNGVIQVRYKDGSDDELDLINPSNWWPIEQDYYEDGFAFTTGAPRPLRVHLKTGLITDQPGNWTPIKGFTDTGIDGGAATVLDLPLHPGKELDRIVLRTMAADVVIGLMSLTLLRK